MVLLHAVVNQEAFDITSFLSRHFGRLESTNNRERRRESSVERQEINKDYAGEKKW